MHLESKLIGCFLQIIFVYQHIHIVWIGTIYFLLYNRLFLKQNFLQERQNLTDDYDMIIDKEGNL